MLHRFLLLLAVLSAPCFVSAQPVPDLLDWHDYYPLQVGNAWEYDELRSPYPRWRYALVADTVIAGRTYYVQQVQSYRGLQLASRETRYLRYDEDLRTVVRLDTTGGTESVLTFHDVPLCDLSAPFGSHCASGILVSGGYRSGEWNPHLHALGHGDISRIPGPASKQFHSTDCARVVHGIGVVDWKPCAEPLRPLIELKYHRVGDREEGYSILRSLPGPDTLDWRDYFPLQVGNAWELEGWSDAGCAPIYNGYRLEIVGDTLIGDRHHFILVEQEWYDGCTSGPRKTFEQRQYVRYDEATRTVTGINLSGCPIDFGADFGSTICDYGSVRRGHEDAVRIGSAIVYRGATKTFGFPGGSAWSFAHGYGPVSWHKGFITFGRALVFARVGGRVYGSSRIERFATSSENVPSPERTMLERPYPNPTSGPTTFAFTTEQPQPVRIEVFDVLGRRIVTLADRWYGAGRYEVAWDANGAPTGLYLVRLTHGSHTETRRLTVAR